MIDDINFIEGDSELKKPRLPICLFILLFSKAGALAHRVTASVHFLLKHTKHSQLNLFPGSIDEIVFNSQTSEGWFEFFSTVKGSDKTQNF